MPKFIAFLLIGTLAFGQAHAVGGSDATFRLQEKDSIWMLEMDLPPSGIETTMSSYLDGELLRDLSRQEYNREILEYVRTHFRLKVDGRLTRIEQHDLKMDEKQAVIAFVLPEMPKRPRLLEAHIPMFAEQDDQTNVLAISRKETPQRAFELSEENGYRIRVAFTNGGLVETQQNKSMGLWGMSLYAIIFISIGILCWLLAKTLWSPST